jgi:hypothetical protein
MITIEPHTKVLIATVPYNKVARLLAINEHYPQTLKLTFVKRIPEVGAWQVIMEAPHNDIGGVLNHYKKHTKSITI